MTKKSRSKKLTSKSLTVLFFALLLGLINNSCSSFYPNVEVTSESFVGIWVLDSSSQSLILNGEKNLKNTKLILSADNSFQLIDIPDCWAYSLSECSNKFSSYQGSWKIYKNSYGAFRLHLNMNNSNDIRSIEVLTGTEFLMGNRTVELDFIAADADLGNIFVFIKQ